MNRISRTRKARVKAGQERLGHNSTFGTKRAAKKVVSIEEMKAAGLLTKAARLKKSKSPKRRAKERAWKQFSLFIRLRDADANGIVTCCTCGSRKHWKKVQAGHYVTRAKEATLFDERCVQGQCAGCNMWQGGKPIEFELYLDKKYGPGTAEEIRRKALMPCRRLPHDYEFIERTYKERVEWIKQHEPSKFNGA